MKESLLCCSQVITQVQAVYHLSFLYVCICVEVLHLTFFEPVLPPLWLSQRGNFVETIWPGRERENRCEPVLFSCGVEHVGGKRIERQSKHDVFRGCIASRSTETTVGWEIGISASAMMDFSLWDCRSKMEHPKRSSRTGTFCLLVFYLFVIGFCSANIMLSSYEWRVILQQTNSWWCKEHYQWLCYWWFSCG